MKICLPSRLRTVLIAALSVSSFTLLSSAHAAGVAETKEELNKTTLTELNADDPITYPNKSAYQLEEVTVLHPAKDISIFKYLYYSDTDSYKAVPYNVVFKEPLGDAKPENEEYIYFQWKEVIDPDSQESTGVFELEPTAEYDADIKAYTTLNERLEGGIESTNVSRSFINLSASDADGGAIFNDAKLKIGNVTGDFIANFSDRTGGAISNDGEMGAITGDFIANFSDRIGGAISNDGEMGAITGDFIANSTSRTAGAIYNGGEMGAITGDFIANFSDGAGGAIYNNKTIGAITGDFIANSSNSNTGAICNASRDSKIESITGDFISNYAQSGATAIANAGEIGTIMGDFITNSTNSYAGAIDNGGMVVAITGDFIANSAIEDAGAISNGGVIVAITGDFIANSSGVRGGAILNTGGSIGFLALDRSMQFRGNFTSDGDGTTKTYEGIYNNGQFNTESTLNFNAYNKNSIVVNDGINGSTGKNSFQIININNGRDGAGEEINAEGKLFSTVVFNSFVNYQTITVHAGELHLGKFSGVGAVDDANYIPRTEAELNNSSLTINAGALVSVQGQLELKNSSSISSSADGVVNGVSTIKGLAADSSIIGSSGVSITIADNSKMKIENITLTEIAINKGNNAELTLQGVTLGAGMTSNSALSLTDSTLILSSSAAPSLTSTRSIDAADYSYYTLTSNVLIDKVNGSFTLNIELTDTSLLGVDGLFGVLFTNGDGAFGVGAFDELSSVNVIINGYNYSDRVEGWSVQDNGLFVVIPEPSTATLSLLALAGLLARRRRKAA